MEGLLAELSGLAELSWPVEISWPAELSGPAELSSLPGTKSNLFVMYRLPCEDANSENCPLETDGATGSKELIDRTGLDGGPGLLPITPGTENSSEVGDSIEIAGPIC